MPDEVVSRLQLSATDQAKDDVRDAVAWLAKAGGDAEHLVSVFEQSVLALNGDISERLASGVGLPPVHAEASEAFGMDVRVQMMQTGKSRARRSSSGLWRILYTLLDVDADGRTDTLLVVGFRHGAARLVGDEPDE